MQSKSTSFTKQVRQKKVILIQTALDLDSHILVFYILLYYIFMLSHFRNLKYAIWLYVEIYFLGLYFRWPKFHS